MTNLITTSLFHPGVITPGGFLTSILAALVLGAFISCVYRRGKDASASMTLSLALLPAIVCVVIIMVNGSLGASVAVAGAFSLVRFRSNPGSAKDICLVFLAMTVGLACGIGYPAYAAISAVILTLAAYFYEKIGLAAKPSIEQRKLLQITLPEDLDYTDVFTDLFEKYTTEATLLRVRTTNLGSLNRLTYDVLLKEKGTEKQFLDELRTRNGNLEITLSVHETPSGEL